MGRPNCQGNGRDPATAGGKPQKWAGAGPARLRGRDPSPDPVGPADTNPVEPHGLFPGQTLAHAYGRAGVWLPAMLLVSFICNVLAVIIPFMQIDAFLRATQTYSLPRSVQLMWASGLYVVAIAVVAFSIVFPFFKLFSLTWVWFRVTDAPRRRRWIEVLEHLGKWSFLDIYVVVVILVLTNDQFFISAAPLAGVYFFLGAITLSMLSSMTMERMTRPRAVMQ